MKKFLIAGAVALLGTGAMADPLDGTVWKTEVDDGAYAHIAMSMCGNAVCGKIAKSFNSSGEYQSPNNGKTLVIDMVPQGGGAYKGKVWRPSNDKIYVGKINVKGNKMDLRGCVAGGLICSKQKWVKIQ